MKKHINGGNKKGFYSVEAAIVVPLVLLAVLSLGYFIRIDGTWENCIHGALDESSAVAAKSSDGISPITAKHRVERRITKDNPRIYDAKAGWFLTGYSDGMSDQLTSYILHAKTELNLPLGFQREFEMDVGVKYRGFVGKNLSGEGLGDGLQNDEPENPVWIFPQSGTKYHKEQCTYVKASVQRAVLTDSVKKKHSACSLCHSENLGSGSIVFCFSGEDTAYHRGSCRSIDRRTMVIDKTEAEEKGYTSCSKCGG